MKNSLTPSQESDAHAVPHPKDEDKAVSGTVAGVLLLIASPLAFGLSTGDPTNPSPLSLIIVLIGIVAAVCSFSHALVAARTCVAVFIFVSGSFSLNALGTLGTDPFGFLIRGGLSALLGVWAIWNLRTSRSEQNDLPKPVVVDDEAPVDVLISMVKEKWGKTKKKSESGATDSGQRKPRQP